MYLILEVSETIPHKVFMFVMVFRTGHVARVGEDRGVHRVLVGKPEGRRPLG